MELSPGSELTACRASRVGWYCHEVPGDFAVVRFLVEKGVDVHARNAAGQNALEVAVATMLKLVGQESVKDENPT